MVESENRKEKYTIPLREFFDKGTTRDVACRIERLKALRRAIIGQMKEIIDFTKYIDTNRSTNH